MPRSKMTCSVTIHSTRLVAYGECVDDDDDDDSTAMLHHRCLLLRLLVLLSMPLTTSHYRLELRQLRVLIVVEEHSHRPVE